MCFHRWKRTKRKMHHQKKVLFQLFHLKWYCVQEGRWFFPSIFHFFHFILPLLLFLFLFLGEQTLLCCCTVFVTVPEDQWPMRQAAVSYRTDRAHCLCYCKVQPQEAILLETKGKPSARLWSCLMWQDAKSHSSPSICGGSGLPLMPSQITETCVNKEVLE